ncbi:MAG TPA: hypothetical protein VLD55_13875 [Candidatus Sulfobium mesophilum]|nr:hypothetical protein [Candidatus Sulfobium mesophilum]
MAQKAMTEHDFQRNLAAAETLARIAQNSVEYNFWVGYIRGLRRFYYGENFGTKDEHSHLIAACDSSYQAEKMLGMGYRAGLIGQNVHQAYTIFKEFCHSSLYGIFRHFMPIWKFLATFWLQCPAGKCRGNCTLPA